MNIGWPEGIFLALILLGMGKAMARFGETKKPDSYDMIDVLFGPALLLGLLWWGGFFA